MTVPVMIINRNLLTWTRQMLEWLKQWPESVEPIILDNDSDYKPLLDWYQTKPCRVVRLEKNFGHRVFWEKGFYDAFSGDEYIVTDPDLDLSQIPDSWLKLLRSGLASYPQVTKAGFGIRLDDIPDQPNKAQYLEWETKFWQYRLDPAWFDAPIDTTFALYSKKRGMPNGFFRAIRSDYPFVVRHLPFYELPGKINDELFHYIDSANESSTAAKYLRGYL